MAEKLSDSERLALKLQKDLEFVLKDKARPFADSAPPEGRACWAEWGWRGRDAAGNGIRYSPKILNEEKVSVRPSLCFLCVTMWGAVCPRSTTAH